MWVNPDFNWFSLKQWVFATSLQKIPMLSQLQLSSRAPRSLDLLFYILVDYLTKWSSRSHVYFKWFASWYAMDIHVMSVRHCFPNTISSWFNIAYNQGPVTWSMWWSPPCKLAVVSNIPCHACCQLEISIFIFEQRAWQWENYK